MFKRPAICFLIIILFLFGAEKSFAYSPKTTHAALTQEIIKFYNLLYPDRKISTEEAEWIIQGSIDEDRDIRPINHFYDPIRKIGWSGEGVTQFSVAEVKGVASIFVSPDGVDIAPATEWVSNRNLQAQHYSRYGGDRTWTQALEYYYGGKTEEAYYTLGHILHLVEDMAVPEHTRNDLHPPGEDSPYEAYADGKWNRSSINNLDIPNKLIEESVVLPSASSISDYLHSLAIYSNKYFFSKDTVNNQNYELRVDENSCDGNLCYGADEVGANFPLVGVKRVKDGLKYTNTYLLEKSDSHIFEAYFTRLAEKSILYGAAVINLFYNDASDFLPTRVTRYNEKSLLGQWFGGFSFVGELSKTWNATKSFFANIGDGVVGIFSNSPKVKTVQVIDESIVSDDREPDSNEEVLISDIEINSVEDDEFDRLSELDENDQELEEVIEEKQEIEAPLIVSTSTFSVATTTAVNSSIQAETKICSFGDSSSIPINPMASVIINEVAWMGTVGSVSDEWIELKNISTSQIDISGFQLLDKDEQIKVVFELGEIIPPGGFYLLERTNNDTIANIPADKIYVGALSNSNEGLRLFDSNCGLLDQVLANPDWPGGSNSSKGTMERRVDLTWQSSGAQGGTPRAENSAPVQFTGGAGGSADENSAQVQSSQTSTSSTLTASVANHVLISEIQVSGVDAGDEFIELYNPTGSAVDMSGWSIQYVSGAAEVSTSTVSKKNFLATSTIDSNKFFLIARNQDEGGADGYTGTVVSDIGHRSFSLSGASAGAKVFLVSNQENIESVTDSDIVDFIDYSFSVPETGQSLERRYFENGVCGLAEGTGEFLGNGCDTDSDADFNIRFASKSQNSKSLPEPREAPTVVSNFVVGYHFSAPTVTLSWNESQDYTGATSTINYRVEEINTPTSSTPFNFNATSTMLEQVIDEIGRDFEFSIQAVDVEGLASTSTVANTTIPSFVNNLYFYEDPRASSTEYLIDLYYTDYPFIPDPYWSTPNDDWKVIVFYYNADAVKGENLSTASIWNPADLNDVLAIKYNECSSGSLVSNYRMILPDNSGRCGVGGGLSNNARIWSDFEDNHLIVRVASSTSDIVFNENEDYITVAYYSLSNSGGGDQSLKLVAVDKNRYLFQTESPAYEAPSVPGNLTVINYTVNSPTSTVEISWTSSSDNDTLDNLISYEWGLDNITFQPVTLTSGGEPKTANVSLSLGSTSTIHIRAVDDFSVNSKSATTTLVLPEAIMDTAPDPSNAYFTVDEAKVDSGVLKIKWRLISAPDTTKAFGIVPYLSASGTPASLDNYRALHRDYGGISGYPFVTGQESSQCNAAITPISDYTFGWQYETRFSAIGSTAVSDDLVGQTLEFALYTRNPSAEPICNIGDAAGSPFFTGLPVVIQ